MQAQFQVNRPIGIEGQPLGADRETKPRRLPWLPQITQVRYTAGSETDDGVLTIVDDESGQTYTVTGTGSATEATFLDNMLAAVEADEKVSDLFSVAEDGVEDLTLTARHANRSYTITASGGPSTTAPAVSNLQEPGGAGLEFGRVVARGSSEKSFRALSASDTIDNIEGVLFRTDANHFHSLENDSASAVDACERGKEYAIAEEIRFLAKVEEAVSPGDPVFVRRALTSGAGRLGGFRASPAGSAQASTFVPTVDLPLYGLRLSVRDASGHVRDFQAIYQPTDGTTAVADAIDGLFDALVDELGGATSAANGFGVTVTESDTELTITTDAGVEIVDLSSSVWQGDTEAVTGTATIGAADVDTIDISSIARYESAAGADGLAEVRFKM